MRVLLIDNGTVHLDELKGCLNEHTVTVLTHGNLQKIESEEFDTIILSGGSEYPVAGNEDKLAEEINLLKTTSLPVLGICYGFELLIAAFGGTLRQLVEKRHGVFDITVTDDALFKNLPTLSAFEAHEWAADTLPVDLLPIATSEAGIEAVQHRSRPLYGVQFHPEVERPGTNAKQVLDNFIALAQQ